MIVSTVAACREAVSAARKSGKSIALVPTMGGLHVGHTSLIEHAKADGHYVVVTIFVNPTQFGPNEDYRAYPRDLHADARLADAAGAELVLAPPVEEIYTPRDEIRVRPGSLADNLCGPFRPGHFDGVLTVVAKLFNIVQPDAAYFGQKDAQQAVLIARMAEDLKFPIRVVVCPIVREADGLACSTRNQYLAPAQRAQATSLYRALCSAREHIARGERSTGRLVAEMRKVLDDAGPCRIDYIAIVDPVTLRDVDMIERDVLIALAVRIGSARLIDNMVVEAPARTDPR